MRLASCALFKWGKLRPGYGTNMTNIEKSARGMYWADDGNLLNQRDQAGAEALIVAKIAPKGQFNDLFEYGVKPHVFVALHNFLDTWRIKCNDLDLDTFVSTPISKLKSLEGWKKLDQLIKSSDEWQSSERYYYIAKMICHASNYGMRGGAFQLNVLEKSRGTIVLTRAQAETYLDNYHSLFPEIHAWHRQVEAQARQCRVLYNLFGFPRILTEQITESNLKEFYAFIPQSTVGCITHIAITQMQDYIVKAKRNWDILNNCHDSFVVQSPANEWEECQHKMKEYLEQELTTPTGEKFNMRSEGQTGRNWGPYKQGKNEEGMKAVAI